MKNLPLRYVEAGKLFGKKKGSSLAASSSFYVILSVVPLTLLFIRMVGIGLGDLGKSGDEIFLLAEGLFPNVAPEMLIQFRSLLSGPLFGGGSFTLVNSLILLITGFSLFNSIWNGLYLMTGDEGHTSKWKYAQGLGIIAISISSLIFLLTLPPLLIGALGFLKTNNVTIYLEQNLQVTHGFIIWIKSISLKNLSFLRSNFFIGFLILGYFTFLYRWFFRFKISWKESFISALSFVTLLFIAKNLFWVYFSSARSILVQNYGDYYTFILACTWIFLVMSFFYFGASLCVQFQKNPLILSSLVEKEENKGHNKSHD